MNQFFDSLKISKSFWTVAIPFLWILITALTSAQSNYLNYVSEGAQRLEKREYAQASEAFQKALDNDLNDPLAHLGLGIAYLLREDIGNAGRKFQEAIEIGSNLPLAYNGLALTYIFSGKIDEAIDKLQQAIKAEPQFKDTYFNLAFAYLLKDKPEESLGECKLIQGDNNKVRHNLLGLAYYKKGMFDEAIANLKEVADAPKSARRTSRLRSMVSATERSLAGELWRGNVADERKLKNETTNSSLFVIARAIKKMPEASATAKESLKPPELQKVKGIATIRFYPPSQGKKVKYAIFYVDDQPKYITNAMPYRYEWDTSTYPNGKHTIVIKGYDEYEQIIFEDKQVLNVFNKEVKKGPKYDPKEYSKILDRFKDMLKLKPNERESYFLLGKAYQQKGSFGEAEAIFENLLLMEPANQEVRSALLETYKLGGKAPEQLGEYWKVHAKEKKVALGLDDGPHPEFTPQILQILEDYQVKATFFLVGKAAEAYPELVKLIVEKGHEVGNHTYSHLNLRDLEPAQIELELLQTKVYLREITGKSVSLFRSPGGHFNLTIREVTRQFGYNTIFWTSNIGTFSKLEPAEIARKMLLQTSEGAIFLLHNGKDKTRFVLPFLIRGLQKEGYSLVTVSELLKEEQ